MSDVLDRFLRYVAYDTQSDERSTTYPSTEKQLLLFRSLTAELRSIGVADAAIDEHGYVMATIPSTTTKPGVPTIGRAISRTRRIVSGSRDGEVLEQPTTQPPRTRFNARITPHRRYSFGQRLPPRVPPRHEPSIHPRIAGLALADLGGIHLGSSSVSHRS